MNEPKVPLKPTLRGSDDKPKGLNKREKRKGVLDADLLKSRKRTTALRHDTFSRPSLALLYDEIDDLKTAAEGDEKKRNWSKAEEDEYQGLLRNIKLYVDRLDKFLEARMQ